MYKKPAGAWKPSIVPKKGKARMAFKRSPGRKTQSATWVSVPYIRHGMKAMKSRKEREKWVKTLNDFLGVSEETLVPKLKQDKMLIEWEGRSCPHCNLGKLGPLKKSCGRLGHRCNRGRSCEKMVRPHHLHPVFSEGSSGQSDTSLADQCMALLCCILGVTTAATCLLFGIIHKTV